MGANCDINYKMQAHKNLGEYDQVMEDQGKQITF